MAALPTLKLYQRGQTVRLSAIPFTLNGVATDPTTVQLIFRNPVGVKTTWTYPTDPIIRDSVGNYHADVLANVVGDWYYRWEGHGNMEAINFDTFYIETERL